MLYLEDYLEMIENLPMEMRDKFTEMREMDLQVSNAMDSLDEKIKTFFKKCGVTPALKPEWKDEQFGKIKQDYQKALEDADEKVQLANQMYDLVDRHLRKLDQEVSKFKMELEADNAGITEVLEKRAAEADKPPPAMNNHRPEKRKYAMMANDTMPRPMHGDRLHLSMPQSDLGLREPLNRPLAAPSPVNPVFEPIPKAPTTIMNYNLGQVGTGSNAAIAVAASRAIGATLEMQQGRRTASLKASFEAVTKSVGLNNDLGLSRDLGSSSRSNAISQGAETAASKSAGRNKKSAVRSTHQQHQQQMMSVQQPIIPVAAELVPPLESLEIVTEEGVATTWQPDPNEPRYCICNDVSYGDMVGCDNEDCPIEWFHYGCVGLAQAPRGKWYCPQCLAAMKRRGRK